METYELSGGPLSGWKLSGPDSVSTRTAERISFAYRPQEDEQIADLLRTGMNTPAFHLPKGKRLVLDYRFAGSQGTWHYEFVEHRIEGQGEPSPD